MPSDHRLRAEEPALLIDFLVLHLKDHKRVTLKNYLRFGSVYVNGRCAARHDQQLAAGDEVIIDPHRKETGPRFRRPPLPIVFEDDSIIIIDKPAGLLTIATEDEKTRTAYRQMNDYLREQNPERLDRVFIVHRLDRDTSGLLLFARTEAVKRQLQDNWDAVEKKYLAVVEGVPRKREGTIESYLRESEAMKVHSSRGPREESKLAITHYEVLKSNRRYALVEVTLETGRKNQIRVHLADLGNPVVGDQKYGSRSDPAKRMALHACALSLLHPVTGERLAFTSRLPQILARLPEDRRDTPAR